RALHWPDHRAADPVTTWAIVPIKAPAQCKTRLLPALNDDARTKLAAAMLRHVAETARGVAAIDQVLVLGPSRHDLPRTTPLLPDHGGGLNAELWTAMRTALEQGVQRLVIIAADLPALARADVEMLASGQDAIVAAPDRAGAGTNALSLPLPAAQGFRFQFGP